MLHCPTVCSGEAVDERDIQPVLQALGRVNDRLGDLRASAVTMPDTPGWRGPTRWMVDRRIDQLHQTIDSCLRLAAAARSTAEADLERARRREHERSQWGLWA